MYRLLASSDLKDDEVHRYVAASCDDVDATGAIGTGEPEPTPTGGLNAISTVEYDAIDLVNLGPLIMLAVAQQQASALQAEAEVRAQALREQNVADACAEGREAAKQELLPSLVAFADAGQALILLEQKLISQSGPRLVELALEIAEKIIGQAVEASPYIVNSVLERAKQEVSEAKQIRVLLHPADHAVLSELRPDLIQVGQAGGRVVEVVATDEIGRGGCRVETESGIVDATIPTQIEVVRRQLLDDH